MLNILENIRQRAVAGCTGRLRKLLAMAYDRARQAVYRERCLLTWRGSNQSSLYLSRENLLLASLMSFS